MFHHAKPSGPSAIYLQVTCSDGRLKYYIGETAEPGELTRGQRAVQDRFRAACEAAKESSRLSGQPLTRAALRASLDRVKGVARPGMFATMREIVDRMERGAILTPRKKRYSPGSLKTYRFTISLLERFRPDLAPETTTQRTYHEFIAWMQSLDYSTNYIGGQIKNWKTLGRLMGEEMPGFKKITEETPDVYLTEEEILSLHRCEDLSARERVVRDWFVLDCQIGLRVSDLTRLKAVNLAEGFVQIATEKTDEPVVIPLSPLAREIVARYGGFPSRVSDQELNRVIKQVCRKAGITARVLFTITKGGLRVDEYLEKWEMVSNHTARRSFITNLRKTGVPDTIIMKLAGIRSAATLARYDKLSASEAGRLAAGMGFFTGPSSPV